MGWGRGQACGWGGEILHGGKRSAGRCWSNHWGLVPGEFCLAYTSPPASPPRPLALFLPAGVKRFGESEVEGFGWGEDGGLFWPGKPVRARVVLGCAVLGSLEVPASAATVPRSLSAALAPQFPSPPHPPPLFRPLPQVEDPQELAEELGEFLHKRGGGKAAAGGNGALAAGGNGASANGAGGAAAAAGAPEWWEPNNPYAVSTDIANLLQE